MKTRHPEKENNPINPIKKKPDWIRSKLTNSKEFFLTKTIVNNNNLVTVCQEANCPNITECWSKRHATFMIMGDTCTRACAFCDVKTGVPGNLDGNIVEKSEHPVNPAGFIIHSAIHSTREDAHCVMHTHTPAGMAAAALKEPIKNIDFDSTSLTNQIAFHDFEGVTVRKEECERLLRNGWKKKLEIHM